MKKIFILLLLITLFSFSGCGNENLSFGNFNFNKVHFSVGEKECCVEIKSWHDNEIGCEVELKNGNVLYLSEGSYILIKDQCPICSEVK